MASSKAVNWKIMIDGKPLQKCYNCAHSENPEIFDHKPKHGVGGKYLEPPIYKDFNVPLIEG